MEFWGPGFALALAVDCTWNESVVWGEMRKEEGEREKQKGGEGIEINKFKLYR